MPKYSRNIQISDRSAIEIYERVSADIDKFMSKTPVKGYEIQRDSVGKIVRVNSSMVTATLTCETGLIRFDVKLSLLASAFRSKLDEGIDRWLQKTFKLS